MLVRYQTLYCHIAERATRRSFDYFCNHQIFKTILDTFVEEEFFEGAQFFSDFKFLDNEYAIFETSNNEPIILEKKDFYDIEELVGLANYGVIDMRLLIEEATATNK